MKNQRESRYIFQIKYSAPVGNFGSLNVLRENISDDFILGGIFWKNCWEFQTIFQINYHQAGMVHIF